MTGKNARQNAFLRLVSGNGAAIGSELGYALLANREVAIGRDPTCQIVLDAVKYRMVSRRHAVVRPLSPSPDGGNTWVICDLNSANGTYLNGERLEGCQELQPGDRILLASDGPQLLFEYEIQHQVTVVGAQSVPTSLAPANNDSATRIDSVSFTQLFPIISTGKDLTSKAFLIPGILTVIFVVLMFATVGSPQANQIIVGTYIAGAAYYFIYRLCGKHKPWWLLVSVALATVAILKSPILDLFIFVFRVKLQGNLPRDESISLTELLLRMFIGAGLMEELLKALPVLGVYLIGRVLPENWSDRVGVKEPLDGILLGTASSVGFTLLETLGQYVPQIAQNAAALQASPEAGELLGLQLLIPRILGLAAGHMAYSGYLGYFIGLAVLKPGKGWQILLVGYLTSAALHALWNTIGNIYPVFLVLIGVISYAFLMAAILKARVISPTRSQNFATRFLDRK